MRLLDDIEEASSIATRLEGLSGSSSDELEGLEIFYASHPDWPNPPRCSTPEEAIPISSSCGSPKRENIHVAVLDSSFNPPTRAHLEIAVSEYPGVETWEDRGGDTTSGRRQTGLDVDGRRSDKPTNFAGGPRYTARLLLLSARNVDKSLKPGDATYAQRIEMMRRLAADMAQRHRHRYIHKLGQDDDLSLNNVAVAALNWPTFVGKAEILRRELNKLPSVRRHPTFTGIQKSELKEDAEHPPRPALKFTFLIGTDTLVRLYEERYYPPHPVLGESMLDQMDFFFSRRSRARSHSDQSEQPQLTLEGAEGNSGERDEGNDIVVARRYTSAEDKNKETAYIESHPECRARVEEGKIRFLDLKRSNGEGVDGTDAAGRARSLDFGEVSSTAIRRAIKEKDNEGLHRLTTPPIVDYVRSQDLYGN